MGGSGDAAANQELQEEELCVLEAIYGGDCVIDREQRAVEIFVPDEAHVPRVVLRALLVDGYPSVCPPVVELQAGHLSDDTLQAACTALEHLFCPGEVVLYNMGEWLKEATELYLPGASPPTPPMPHGQPHEKHDHSRHRYGTRSGGKLEGGTVTGIPEGGGQQDEEEEEDDEDWQEGDEDEEASDGSEFSAEGTAEGVRARVERGRTESGAAERVLMDGVRGRIVSGEPITERKSTFQAHVCPISSPDEVQAVVEVLLESNKIRNATHNIMAYRLQVPGKGTLHQDCDDDGEDAAGGRLLHLLQVSGTLNVVVVVSRWFGGVKLGPSRFGLINNAGRALLEAQGFITPGGGGGKGAAHKGKAGHAAHKR